MAIVTDPEGKGEFTSSQLLFAAMDGGVYLAPWYFARITALNKAELWLWNQLFW
ncbi:hypothetical protein [Nitrosomonas halophila]|uniref:Uncharacterized protein n=1 Tax=Nitrosomonas halophila TaxID=44576 RepID=A0A1H3G0Q8_9PROT|nr:hypothetical protein [Nitrosomonas halophila]SDX96218.1 hypothetical protein SAMN05421881_101363 [Nitrosomonas halophila]HRQ05140.1 hypothetical protein [Nitrosomonas halophila]